MQPAPPPAQPAWQPPAQPKRPWYRRWWAITLLALAGLLAIGSLLPGEEQPATTAGGTAPAEGAAPEGTAPENTAPDRPEQPAQDTPTIGQPARDGMFTFVVRTVDCGRRRIGSEFFPVTAQGVFCLVTVDVTNHGDEPRTLEPFSQKAFDARGREYSADDEAWAALEDSPLLEEINPGNRVRGVLVFDVPRGTQLTRLELHDSPFSGGVTVALR